jgi:hypothetical protein
LRASAVTAIAGVPTVGGEVRSFRPTTATAWSTRFAAGLADTDKACSCSATSGIRHAVLVYLGAKPAVTVLAARLMASAEFDD